MAAPSPWPAAMLRLVLRGASALAGGSRPKLVARPAEEALQGPGKSPFLQIVREYARPVRKKKEATPSHLDDLPGTMLRKDYANVSAVHKVDDVVRRMLSLEMASQKEKVKMKKEQLAAKVRRNPNDCGSAEVQVAYLTAMIRTLKEHLHMHPKVWEQAKNCWRGDSLLDNGDLCKDKVNLTHMMIATDRRTVLLKYLRNSRYDIFEKTCKQLEIEYSPPPQYRRKITRRAAVKKEFRAMVYKEKQKLRALERLQQMEKQDEGIKEQAQPKEEPRLSWT